MPQHADFDHLTALLAWLREAIDDAEAPTRPADAQMQLTNLLWRLRTLYRLATDTDPWPETRR
jgi:hypothetical protein